MTSKPMFHLSGIPLTYPVIPPDPVDPCPCAREKLDGAAIMEYVRPALENLLHLPYDPQRMAYDVRAALTMVLDHPQSVYRAIERGHVYAYPREGSAEQYIAWQGNTWVWQDVDGDMNRLRLTVNP